MIQVDAFDVSLLRLIEKTKLSTGGGVDYVDLQPDSGKRWKILGAIGYHDEPVSVLSMHWNIDLLDLGSANRTINEPHSLHSWDGDVTDPSIWTGPLLAMNALYPRLIVLNLAAGRTLHAEAVVAELSI